MSPLRSSAPARRRPVRVLVAVLALAAVPVVVARPPTAHGATRGAAPGEAEGYRPPVDAPIIDRFRPPPHPYGPGNRGLTYATAPLTPVRAAASGEVVFAGQVAGTLHVTVRHADGLRTSYSFLAAIAVREGATVAAGTIVGWSGEVLHLGVRAPDGTYLDPELLWSRRWEPRLVPGGDDHATVPSERAVLGDVVRERRAPLSAWLATGGAALVDLGASTRAELDRRLQLWRHYATELRPMVHGRRLLAGVERWRRERLDCTLVGAPVAAPAERRIVVEVGGIGSTSDAAAIARLDTATLGYDDRDVVRFSYAGGRVPPPVADRAPDAEADPFAAITTTPYDPADSQGDLEESGRRLAVLLDDIARAEPGVPIDVVAHSQGGVVARLALDHAARTGQLPNEVQNLVTLGSPHQGADLATAVEAVRSDPAGSVLLEQARGAMGLELDPALPAAGQLSEVSPVIEHLDRRAVPSGVRFTSIAARGDLVVPAGRTRAPGARTATVSVVGVAAHDHLPEAPEATHEILLALHGRPPACRSLTDTLADVAVSDGIGFLEDSLGATAAGAGVLAPG